VKTICRGFCDEKDKRTPQKEKTAKLPFKREDAKELKALGIYYEKVII